MCEHLIKVGLEEKAKRESELASYSEAQKDACLFNQEKSVEKVKEYEEFKAKVKLLHPERGQIPTKDNIDNLEIPTLYKIASERQNGWSQNVSFIWRFH